MANSNGRMRKEWALLTYIAGDNNLSNEGLRDLEELSVEGTSPDVYVGVEIDTAGDHEGSIRYEITERESDRGHRTVLERLSEQDTGAPVTLTNFLKWGFGRFPAENTAAVIWGHGDGFKTSRTGIATDFGGDGLDIPEVEGALREAGVPHNRKLRVLGFDACLMSMLEIAHHLADHTELIVGSQQTEPGNGWPYDRVLRALKRLSSAEEFASQIVDEYISHNEATGRRNVTQSAIRTAKTNDAVEQLGRLGQALKDSLRSHQANIREMRPQLQSFGHNPDYVDLIHLTETLPQYVNDPSVITEAQEAKNAAHRCVVRSARLGDSVQHANGLSIWFPPSPAIYYAHRPKYGTFKCVEKAPGWMKFLDALYSS